MIINIIGRGSGWEQGYEAEGEKWSINYWTPQTTRLFNIHPFDHEYYTKNIRDIENARAAGCIVVTQENFDMPLAMKVLGTDFFSSSVDWLIALAILEGKAEEIHLWGCCMSDPDHYEKRVGTNYWIGYANALGIKVVIHGNSTICTNPDGLTYGTFTPMKRKYCATTDNHV